MCTRTVHITRECRSTSERATELRRRRVRVAASSRCAIAASDRAAGSKATLEAMKAAALSSSGASGTARLAAALRAANAQRRREHLHGGLARSWSELARLSSLATVKEEANEDCEQGSGYDADDDGWVSGFVPLQRRDTLDYFEEVDTDGTDSKAPYGQQLDPLLQGLQYMPGWMRAVASLFLCMEIPEPPPSPAVRQLSATPSTSSAVSNR